jgi:hypothetical protein
MQRGQITNMAASPIFLVVLPGFVKHDVRCPAYLKVSTSDTSYCVSFSA